MKFCEKHTLPEGGWVGTTTPDLTCSFCERERLAAENARLRALLERCCDALALDEWVLKDEVRAELAAKT